MRNGGMSMKFPLPELNDSKFTMCRYPLPDAPNGIRKQHHFYDNGICHGCDKTHVRTCKVGDLPNLCQQCYDWMKKYSHMDDPYHMKRIPVGSAIEDELVKKAIRYAKVKTMDVAGVTSMTTGAILLHAYKAYKEALEEGASEEEARARQNYIERQDALQSQAEMEEEVRQEAHRQELARKMRENQRIIDAQQARLNRLAGKNVANRSDGNIEAKKQEVRVRIDEKEVAKQIEAEDEEVEVKTKISAFLRKYKVPIGILVIVCIIFPQIRYPVLFVVFFMIIVLVTSCIEVIFERFK